MTDLMQDLLDYRLPGLDLFEGAIHPSYGRQSILNVPSSVCRLLGVPPLAPSSLRADLLDPLLAEETDTVVAILMDALAYHRLARWLAEDDTLPWHDLAARGVLAPLTSIAPSTTSAAITAYWTAFPAAQHGVMGYEMWLKEYGIVTNMIQHKPIAYRRGGGGLEAAGFEPEAFIPVPSISHHLRAHGVTPHVFQNYSIIHSGLSSTFFGDAELHGINTAADLWISVRELLDAAPTARRFVWVYWGTVDTYSHIHGPDDERTQAEFQSFSAAFERYFLRRLGAEARARTTVILAADHGQKTTDRGNPRYDLSHHPRFLDMLHINPTGENRFTYLFVKPGQVEAVRAYIAETWPGEFQLIDPAAAAAGGLFGPGPFHPRLAERTGDLLAVSRGDAYWWWAGVPDPLIGRHGGLTADEMIVPFLAAHL